MARNCPKDQVRALVEGTLDLEDSLSQDVTAHLEGCASCRKLRSKLEAKERAFRAAIGSFGAEDSSRCPAPSALATVAEKGLDDADAALVDHLARCAMCRSALLPASVVHHAASSAKAPDETLAIARRRVGIARTHSDEQPIQQPAKAPSGRRLRTGRAPALAEATSSKGGLLAAAVAILFVGGALFLVVRDNASRTEPDPTATQRPQTPVKPVPAPPSDKPTPIQAPKPTPPSIEDDVVAQLPVEEEPLEFVPGPVVQRPEPPVTPSEPPKPAPPATAPGPTTPGPTTPTTPKTDPRPDSIGPRPEPKVLACKVDAVSGPVEIRKKAEKTWRKLSVAELVQDGDGLRSKGEDGSLTFAHTAKVTFTNDASGTVTIKSTGVCVSLESGSLDGESLTYDGLEVRAANGFVTAWKGSRIRVDASDKGLRVSVEKGTANAGNDLGKVTVHSGYELTIVMDRRPNRPTRR